MGTGTATLDSQHPGNVARLLAARSGVARAAGCRGGGDSGVSAAVFVVVASVAFRKCEQWHASVFPHRVLEEMTIACACPHTGCARVRVVMHA